MAEVIRILGKTGDGSRLLELRLLEKEAPPFYAAASNVLVMPDAGATNGVADAAAPGAAHAAANGAAHAPSSNEVPAESGAVDAAAAGTIGGEDAGLARDPSNPAATPELPGSPAAPAAPLPAHAGADASWALDGSAVPGGAPLPGSVATPVGGPPAEQPTGPASGGSAAAGADDAEPKGPTDEVAVGSEDAAEQDEDSALPDVIGTPHGPVVQPDEDDADAVPGPPTIPLDPRVHWIR